MVYFALPVAQLFLQGVDQRFLFGQALFQQEDVVRRDVVHKPVFYRAYSVTTRIKRFTAWSGRFSKSVELHDKVIGHYLNIKHYQ
ncbi:IS1 family transposase [Escherichia coli]|uniref:IS1 family transposase n=2 Tax=Escherichia coli TaxID=562 RepID=UPI0028830553|nr:IS1 family transposase [Escherichia coli]